MSSVYRKLTTFVAVTSMAVLSILAPIAANATVKEDIEIFSESDSGSAHSAASPTQGANEEEELEFSLDDLAQLALDLFEEGEELPQRELFSGEANPENFVLDARTFMGTPYRTGATGPSAFDCSGYIYYILKGYGISTPRSSVQMSENSSWMYIADREDFQKGDLIFFKSPNSGSGVGHVGIYLGEGYFIHCTSSSRIRSVTISTINGGYYESRVKWGRRIFNIDAANLNVSNSAEIAPQIDEI